MVAYFSRKISESPDPQIQRLKILHIDDTQLNLSRDVYASARAEKDARATFSSAIKRALDRDTLVIADGMNYIKGFRYQLYCEAKAVRTTSCVVYVAASAGKCRERNVKGSLDSTSPTTSTASATTSSASPSTYYGDEVLENLMFRFEEPNGMARWDRPLFVVAEEDGEGPWEEVWEALVGTDGKQKVVRPHAATVLKPAAEQGYLYELDKVTSDVVGTIMEWLQDHVGEGGGEVRVAQEEVEEKVVVLLPVVPPSLPQLQRLRRQFIALQRQHGLSKSRIRDLFVDYLNDAFET